MRHHFRFRRWHGVAAVAVAGAAIGGGVTVAQNHHSTPTSPSGLGVGCGKERWDVKTLTDPAASQVNLTSMNTTIAALRAMPAPASPTARTIAEESTYRISATVFAYKEEADSDLHLAVKDAQGQTMIVEIPDPGCMGTSPVATQVGTARTLWLGAHPLSTSFVTVNVPVTVTGVLFFDRLHGQTGVAPNGVELHPVLSLTLGGTP